MSMPIPMDWAFAAWTGPHPCRSASGADDPDQELKPANQKDEKTEAKTVFQGLVFHGRSSVIVPVLFLPCGRTPRKRKSESVVVFRAVRWPLRLSCGRGSVRMLKERAQAGRSAARRRRGDFRPNDGCGVIPHLADGVAAERRDGDVFSLWRDFKARMCIGRRSRAR
jgi:hypothetical protein